MRREIRCEESGCQIVLDATFIGEDILVAIYGGDQAHIGAVAISTPRKSLQDGEKTSSSTSVFVYPGHKEDDLAKNAAGKMAKILNKKIVLTCGIHLDAITASDIQRILKSVDCLVDEAVERMGKLIQGRD